MTTPQAASDALEKARCEFEKWITADGDYPHLKHKNFGGNYLHEETAMKWDGFKEGYRFALLTAAAQPATDTPNNQTFNAYLKATNTAGEGVKPLCHDVDFGTYQNAVAIKAPWGDLVTVDICMIPEVKWLWDQGIKTRECCCGHGVRHGYVAVSDESRDKMLALGYVSDPSAPHCYVAKSAALLSKPAAVPDGWVLVPISPTDEMIEKGARETPATDISTHETSKYAAMDIYEAMLSVRKGEKV